ncbi:MAG: hypothetical protein PHE47_08735 [Oscillospiraceae bacterium]|nr:hypothetical protein [Oscillospiraceae bacterium]
MAQYNETIYAGDSWTENYVNGELADTVRGASLASLEQFSFTYDGYDYFLYAESESWFNARYPLSAQYQKKRLVQVKQYVYVTGTSSSSSGTIKSGRFVFGYDDGISELFEVGVSDAGIGELTDLTKNQYNLIGTVEGYDGRLSNFVKVGYAQRKPNVWAGCTGGLYTGNRYTAKASMTVQSHTGENRPYIVCTYEDVIPAAKDCAPKSGFVNDKAANVFRWRFWANDTAVAQPVRQQAYQFRWRVTGESAYQESSVTSGEESHTVPKNTFPAEGSVDWCVRVQSNDGIWSDWSDWMTLTTVDSLSKPTGLRPDLGYVDGNLPQTFYWKHVIATGTAQSQYELQYRTGEEAWVSLAAAVGDQTQADIPQDTLPSGKVFWQVRTANSDGVWGEWSDPASIVVRARPPAPVISQVDPAPRPLILWQAADQQGYQVKVGGFDSKEQYGGEKQWRCPSYLADGNHLAAVRVQNSFGLWSEWAQASITVKNGGTGSIRLTSRKVGNEIRLSWTATGNFSDYLIKRDGVMIGSTRKQEYSDRRCAGKHQYEVIGAVEGGHYVTSGPLTEFFTMSGAAISGRDDVAWIPLAVRRDGPPIHQLESAAQVAYQHYYGIDLPVAEIAQAKNRRHRMAFSILDNGQLQPLQALLGGPVIYKDQWGYCLFGILDGITVDFKRSSDVTFWITEIEWGDADEV